MLERSKYVDAAYTFGVSTKVGVKPLLVVLFYTHVFSVVLRCLLLVVVVPTLCLQINGRILFVNPWFSAWGVT